MVGLARHIRCDSCTAQTYVSPFTTVKRCASCDTFHVIPPEPGLPDSVFRLLDIARYNLDRERWDEVKDLCRHAIFLDEENPEAYYLSLMATLQVRTLADLDDYDGLFLDKRDFKLFFRYGEISLVNYIKSIGERNLARKKLALHKFRFRAAVTACNHAKTADDLRRAAAMFERVPGFQNADFLKASCIAEAEKLEQRYSGWPWRWIYPYGA